MSYRKRLLDVGEIPVEGFTQVGDIYGRKFATWVAVINGNRCNISQGMESNRYWIEAEGTFNGSYKSLNVARNKLIRWAKAMSTGKASNIAS